MRKFTVDLFSDWSSIERHFTHDSVSGVIRAGTRPLLPGPSCLKKSGMPSTVKYVKTPRSSLRSDLRNPTSPQMPLVSSWPLASQLLALADCSQAAQCANYAKRRWMLSSMDGLYQRACY